MNHSEMHPTAGQVVIIKRGEHAGQEYRVEDYWDRVSGKSWMHSAGNPACLMYAIRAGKAVLPPDDEVLYGKIGPFGHLVHVSELE